MRISTARSQRRHKCYDANSRIIKYGCIQIQKCSCPCNKCYHITPSTRKRKCARTTRQDSWCRIIKNSATKTTTTSSVSYICHLHKTVRNKVGSRQKTKSIKTGHPSRGCHISRQCPKLN